MIFLWLFIFFQSGNTFTNFITICCGHNRFNWKKLLIFFIFIFWLIFDLFLLFLWIDEDAWWCSTLVTIILAVLFWVILCFFSGHDCSVSIFFCYVLLFTRWIFFSRYGFVQVILFFFCCSDKTWSNPIFLISVLYFLVFFGWCWNFIQTYVIHFLC